MVREEQLRLLKGLINHLDNKTNVNAGGILKTPADTYISEDRFEKEWNSFFLNHPHIFLIHKLCHQYLIQIAFL